VNIVTSSNVELLFEARLAIDGPDLDLEKLRDEVTNFAEGKDGRRAFIICEGEQVLGYVECKLHGNLNSAVGNLGGLENIGHVAKIGVRAEHRVKGIGTRLLVAAHDWLRLERKLGVWLDYHSENKSAIALYAKSGYKEIVRFPDPKKPRRSRIVAVKHW